MRIVKLFYIVKMMRQILIEFTDRFTPVLNPAFVKSDYYPVDMSSSNPDLNLEMLSQPLEHHRFLQQYLTQQNAKVAFGGYLERRGLYDRSEHFQKTDALEKRNIHLGVDLWCEAGTKVHSPLHGVIHSFQNNENFGDYGPTIVLQHKIEEHTFHTLYGHLSLESLEGKLIGQSIEAGESIATLGGPEVNGDYAPHLHFQIVIDMQNKKGDYPGVCSGGTLDFYQKNCPDPNLILKIS